MISVSRRGVSNISLFWDVKQSKSVGRFKKKQTGCSETSVTTYLPCVPSQKTAYLSDHLLRIILFL